MLEKIKTILNITIPAGGFKILNAKDFDEIHINLPEQEPSEVKLPEKLDLNKKCRMYDHKIGHTKNAIYVAPTGAVLETEFIINQLIDFCESLQARVKELESGIIKREYGE